MLFNINIDQRSYHDLGIKISIEAAAVLYMLRGKMGDVSFQEETLKENGKLYFWFKHSLVYKELEILFTGNESDEAISKKVRRIMSELETNGLIERHPHPVQLKKSMYCFTALTQTVFSSYKSDEANGQKRPSKVNHSDKSVQVTRTKMSESKAIHSDKNGIEEVNKKIIEENKLATMPELARTENNQQSGNANPKATATDTKDVLVQTNKEFVFIETPEELADKAEVVINEYAESFKKDYERKGFLATNARDYAVEFATQFFKTFQFCSLDNRGIRRKISEWSYIFAKVNLEIAQAQKAVNMTLPPQYKTPTAGTPTKKNLNLLSMLD